MSEMEAGVEDVSATPEISLDQMDNDGVMVTDGFELALPSCSDEIIKETNHEELQGEIEEEGSLTQNDHDDEVIDKESDEHNDQFEIIKENNLREYDLSHVEDNLVTDKIYFPSETDNLVSDEVNEEENILDEDDNMTYGDNILMIDDIPQTEEPMNEVIDSEELNLEDPIANVSDSEELKLQDPIATACDYEELKLQDPIANVSDSVENDVPQIGSSESDCSLVKSPNSLPDCKNKRSYVCGYCNMLTTNPRVYLYHLRDQHKESMNIYECSRCIYASRFQQKLVRHSEMVHKISMRPPKDPDAVVKKKVNKKSPKQSPNYKPMFMNRSPRESKSPRRFEEYEFPDDDTELDMEDDEVEPTQVMISHKSSSKRIYHCDQCDYTSTNAKVLTKHENQKHLKKKNLKCTRCNYSTHIRSRFTKHMKYHKLKIVKCSYCDFRTPYPWNLDRHNKNHTEEMGEHKCHLCNFTTQVKQSLTVHIANHHLTPEQVIERESKRTIGVSDPSDDALADDEESELLRMERDEDPDALQIPSSFTVSSIDVESHEELEKVTNQDRDSTKVIKKPKIKITLKKMKNPKIASVSHSSNERHNFNEDFIHPDDMVQRNGSVYIKSEKCSLCSFKAPFQTEIIRHKKKVHGIYSLKNPFSSGGGSKKTKKAKLYEPLINGNEFFTDDGFLKNPFDDLSNFVDENSAKNEVDESPSNIKIEDETKESDDGEGKDTNSGQKRKSSFFDKLQEKLSSSNVQNLVCQFCGHESKCLSESVRHQKLHLSAKNIYASASLSTRCQFCRHRCKTTDDLMNHLKLCPEARKNQISDNMKEKNYSEDNISSSKQGASSEEDEIKYPIQSKVFVWNNIYNFDDDERSGTPLDNASDSTGTDTADNKSGSKSATSRVYRCPQCSFRSTTASRFHVHMVGHINIKPYSCSECAYRSNWRWDITKHIKLKLAKDRNHETAEVIQSTETLIEKNYEKYDQYLTEVSRDEIHHSEGGLSNSRKGPSKRSLLMESDGSDSAKSSPCPTPNPSTSSKLPAPPKLIRAPNSLLNPSEPLLAGDTQKLPPLVAMANQSVNDRGSTSGLQDDNNSTDQPDLLNNQTILPQDRENMADTSLETLQLLASGSTNLARLKRQQQEAGEGKDPELDAAIANQMRLILWLNCLAGGAEKKEGERNTISSVDSSKEKSNSASVEPTTGAQDPSNIMQLVLDHEGNPEWKCSTCEFRDNEQDTVATHVKLAHGKKGPVSLVHAVHRCSVCGFAAGTKRHVQVHLHQVHNGEGGIISRSEGQNVEPDNGSKERTYDCRLCPFKSKKKGELKGHLSHHTPRADFIFKCMFCSFFVATKNELFSHLSLHGMDIPAANAKDSTDPITTNVTSQPHDDNGARQFMCDMCPFETRSRAKLMHHRQFHRPRGLPFSCPHCSYNVTRRHLLAQHLRIHGVVDEASDERTTETNNQNLYGLDPTLTRKSPSPSLTITPISSMNSAAVAAKVTGVTTSNIDASCLPILSDELTKNLHDIPLVWVSRDYRYFKMFKCRHCPHVNLRKTNIQEHEKMHKSEGLPPGTGHSCSFCTYVCINAGVMSAHIKVHSGSMGVCHAIVDPAMPNENQLKMLANSRSNMNTTPNQVEQSDEKVLYYCQHCPARFFLGKEVQIHSRFHSCNYPFLCDKCNFRAREESQVLAHAKVHTSDYQERTRTLMTMHPPAPDFQPVPGLSVPGEKPVFGVKESDVVSNKSCQSNGLSRPWLATPPPPVGQNLNSMPQPPPTSRFKCDLCPSSFTKQITLQYHQSLHGADNQYRCSRCNYAAKTPDGLQQHSALHDQVDFEKSSNGSFHSATPSPAPSPSPQKMIESALSIAATKTSLDTQNNVDQPPIKLKFIGLKGNGTSSKSTKKPQFKYYIEEQVPLSGIELLKRKHQIEQELPEDALARTRPELFFTKPPINKQESKDRAGNPELNYPLHIDKVSGKTREKRYKCMKCPSAFEKMDQFNVHINLHGTNCKYKCKLCDYTVKFYANFMMHIRRHIYHEKVDAQNKGIPPPIDDDPRFHPIVDQNFVRSEKKPENNSVQDKENVYNFDSTIDMTTAEKQQIVLQNKKAEAFLPKDEDKDRRVFYCEYCPYANVRRDAVDSHSLRHQANGGKGLYQCNFCDYTASGPNFIREHTKVHFRPFKYVVPEGFMRHEKLELWSIKSGEELSFMENEDVPKKSQIFSHDDGVFGPVVENDVNAMDLDVKKEDEDDTDESGILVDFRSGDVIEAPNSFIIPLRPSKGKSHVSNGSSKSSKSRSKKAARKHTKINKSSGGSRSAVIDEPMDFDDSSSSTTTNICNGEENPVVNGKSSPSLPQEEELSDESNQSLYRSSSVAN